VVYPLLLLCLLPCPPAGVPPTAGVPRVGVSTLDGPWWAGLPVCADAGGVGKVRGCDRTPRVASVGITPGLLVWPWAWGVLPVDGGGGSGSSFCLFCMRISLSNSLSACTSSCLASCSAYHLASHSRCLRALSCSSTCALVCGCCGWGGGGCGACCCSCCCCGSNCN
jgi:hypothetical protein